jgi:hypothetical protein
MRVTTEFIVEGDLERLQAEFVVAAMTGAMDAFLKQPLSTYFKSSIRMGTGERTVFDDVARLACSINALPMERRTLDLLKGAGYLYIWQIVEKSMGDILRISGFGRGSETDMLRALEAFGLRHSDFHSNADLIAQAKLVTADRHLAVPDSPPA